MALENNIFFNNTYFILTVCFLLLELVCSWFPPFPCDNKSSMFSFCCFCFLMKYESLRKLQDWRKQALKTSTNYPETSDKMSRIGYTEKWSWFQTQPLPSYMPDLCAATSVVRTKTRGIALGKRLCGCTCGRWSVFPLHTRDVHGFCIGNCKFHVIAHLSHNSWPDICSEQLLFYCCIHC